MESTLVSQIAAELGLSRNQVAATLTLLGDGATVPFISRYRKEATGSLDEVAIQRIRDRYKQLTELEQRRTAILKSIQEQGKLSPALQQQIENADTLSLLEDLYLPYRPKRRTRATIAREKGLEPLAELLMRQGNEIPEKEARPFVIAQKGVESAEDALAGARDIIAEWINENPEARAQMRGLFSREAVASGKVIKGKEEAGARFRDYFKYTEKISHMPSHRVLAVFRAEEEKIVNLQIAPDEERAVALLEHRFLQRKNHCAAQVREAIHDSYKRLMAPSLENEMRAAMKEKADAEAIRVFAENLRQLLMEPPLGLKVVMAVDPGFRTGCKVVILDRQGKLLFNDTIWPHPPQHKAAEAEVKVRSLVDKYQVEAIAVGNGTAGRETDDFIRDLKLSCPVTMVNESGASVYSASEVAREEFPDKDVTVRGAVSIGRRLMDPLAELVKIDPKSIGVGQYQHDVNQTALKESLDEVVMSCVNQVGVDLNTASRELLTYVSGLGPQLASRIVEYRNGHGAFRSRSELKKVPRLGERAFEQAAGFLRIRESKHPLDASAVHPESYAVVERIAKQANCSVAELMRDESKRSALKPESFADENTGLPTLLDIFEELARPGRDPRGTPEAVEFAEGINSIENLEVGMVLTGIVTNVTRFGAFVDIGVHQDGLVHISELADRFVKDPAEVVKVRQKVKVKVVQIDLERGRIGLSMRGV